MFQIKKKLFFLPIEIKSREFYPKLYFLYEALKKNYSCFIGDKAGIFRATKYFNSGIYFYKSINFTDTNHILKIKNNNNNYIVQDEEGGFSFSNEKEFQKFLTFRSSLTNVKLIDRFYNWGKFDYENCIRRFPKQKKKFLVTGGVRFEVCKKKNIKKIYKNLSSQFSLKNYILITTSHLTSKKEINNYINSDKTFMKLVTKKQRETRYKDLEELLELNIKFKELIKFLTIKFPNLTILVRPHPSESSVEWQNYLTKNFTNKKVFIDYKSDINSLIYNSLCVINSKSSAGLHSYFQGKPIISYIPKEVKYRKRVFDYIGEQAKSLNDIQKIVLKILNKEKLTIKKDVKNYVSRYVNNLKNNNSSEIILKDVKKFYKKKSKINLLKIILLAPLYQISDFFFKILKIRYHNPKLSISAIRLSSEKMREGIRKKEILNFFKNTKLHKKIKVFSFGKNCFFIYKQN